MGKFQLSPLAEVKNSYSSAEDVLFKRKIMRSVKVVEDRLLAAELKLEPDAITLSVMNTAAWASFAASKENKINYAATEPTGKYVGMLWMDTSATPKLLKRWNGTAWEATAYTGSEIDVRADAIADTVVAAYAYSKDSVDTLLANYSTIVQTATDITLNIGTVRQAQGNLVPYTQQDFEQGSLSLTTGLPTAATTVLRMKNYIPLFPSTDYLLEVSVGTADAYIVLYTAGHVFSRYLLFTGGSIKITTLATEVEFKVRLQKNPVAVLTLAEMPNYKCSVTQVGKYLTGAKYTFDGTKLRIDDAGFEMWYGGVKKVYFDTVTSKYVFEGKIDADSGVIGGFTIGADRLTAGSGTSAVGIAPGLLISGYYYSFWAGADSAYSAPFRVQRNGYMSVTSATIGGWVVTANSISKGGISLNNQYERIYVGNSAYLYSYGTSVIGLSGSLRVTGSITSLNAVNANTLGALSVMITFSGTTYLLTRDASGYVKATTVV